MENIIIGIVSADRAFSKALGISLMAVCDDFIIKAYDTKHFVSEWSAYQEQGDLNEKFDIILWDGKEIEDTYRGNIVYLAEKASMVRKDFQGRKFSIYKYCGAPAMSAAIFEIYTSLTGRGTVFVRKDKVSLFAFGSWEGGSGCTTVALSVAQELQRFRGKKTLVISLETVESTARYFGIVPELRSIGEYLYRVLPEESITGEKTTPFIESYVVKDLYGIEAFAPSKSRNPLVYLSGQEMQKLIATLIDSGRYEAIVIDIGTCLTEAVSAAVEMADKVCFVTGTQRLSKREEMYLGHILVSTGEETMVKSVRLTNMYSAEDPIEKEMPERTPAEQFISNRAVAHKFEDIIGHSEPSQIVLEGAFGEDIRNLTGMLLKQ